MDGIHPSTSRKQISINSLGIWRGNNIISVFMKPSIGLAMMPQSLILVSRLFYTAFRALPYPFIYVTKYWITLILNYLARKQTRCFPSFVFLWRIQMFIIDFAHQLIYFNLIVLFDLIKFIYNYFCLSTFTESNPQSTNMLHHGLFFFIVKQMGAISSIKL